MATPFEVLGGISAVVQILQTAIDVATKVQAARDKKGLASVIKANRKEVESLRDIVAIVDKEKVLQTKTILEEIAEILELAKTLEDLLKLMEDASFTSRVVHGKNQKEELSSLTGEIAKRKSNLTMKIQGAHVGLTVSADKKFVVQMEKIESLDANLKRLINGFDGLSIVEVVKGKEPNADGTVPLDDSDLEELGVETEDGSPYREGSRIIRDNMAIEQALMINGTIGTDGFIEPKHVVIINNVARGQATMVNAAISKQIFKEVREDRMEVLRIMASQGLLGRTQANIDPQKETGQNGLRRIRDGRVERSQGQSVAQPDSVPNPALADG